MKYRVHVYATTDEFTEEKTLSMAFESSNANAIIEVAEIFIEKMQLKELREQKVSCDNCKDAGVIITKTMWKGDIPRKYYYITSCHDCGRGTDARCHIMMHVQNKEPCDCEYRNILNYWNKRTNIKEDINEHKNGAIT